VTLLSITTDAHAFVPGDVKLTAEQRIGRLYLKYFSAQDGSVQYFFALPYDR